MMDPSPARTTQTYQAGTLTYSKPALVILFFWLLWGDFCFVLMETVTPSLMPLRFHALGASNTEMGLILGTIPAIIYSVLNPIVSFRSDRFRSRWGRRIPFLAVSLPFMVLSLISVAYAQPLALWMHDRLGPGVERLPTATVIIGTLSFFLIVFAIFNTLGAGMFWYLFNDVVPEHLLARFMSWFRIVSMGASAFYNFFIFRYAGTHSTEILVGAALLYLVGFGLMCLNVREGSYPPPPPYVDGGVGPWAAVKTYARECHSFRIYWDLWLSTFLGCIGGGVITFNLLFQLAIGLSLAEIGEMNGTLSLATGALILVSGWLADKYHPIRISLAGMLLGLLVVLPANLVWLFWHPSPRMTFWVAMFINVGLGAPLAALNGVWDPPMLMRLFPRTRYGQFCSANGIWRAVGAILGGVAAGSFLDLLTRFQGKERAYFFIPLWQILFAIPSLYFFLRMYHSWKRRGGDNGYVPPVLNSSLRDEMKLQPELASRATANLP